MPIDEKLRELAMKVEALLRIVLLFQKLLEELARLIEALVGERSLRGGAKITHLTFPMLGHSLVLQGVARPGNTLFKTPCEMRALSSPKSAGRPTQLRHFGARSRPGIRRNARKHRESSAFRLCLGGGQAREHRVRAQEVS